VSRRTDPRQQAFWSAAPPTETEQRQPTEAVPCSAPPPPAPDLTAIAAGDSAGSPTDQSEAGVDLERTAEVFSRLLPLLRQLRDRASSAAAPAHDGRILSGDSQTSAQDANNDLTQGSTQGPRELPDDIPRDRIDVSESDARTTPGTARRPSAGLEEEP
jgi:hypothetical protein